MQTLRSHNIIERTSQGEQAWRTLPLEPQERALLGVLRRTQPVSELLMKNIVNTDEIENLIHRLASQGWIRIHEPAEIHRPVSLEDPSVEDIEVSDDELKKLLKRHRENEELERSLAEQQKIEQEYSPESDPLSVSESSLTEQPVASEDPLVFSPENDGLLDALRNPELFQPTHTDTRPAFAPPSGGLAALLKTLGEEVPINAEVSPDQEESLRGLKPLETWGNIPMTTPFNQRQPSSFLRLKDQPEESSPRSVPPQTAGLLKQSLSKIQQEEADAKVVRDRALAYRQQRDQQASDLKATRATQKANEIRQQQEQTLMGLSKRLERISKDRSSQ